MIFPSAVVPILLALHVLPGDPIEFAAPRAIPLAQAPRTVAAEDVNGDGLLDLVAIASDRSYVSVRLALDGDLFSPELVTAIDGASGGGMVFADFDEDGRRDALVSSSRAQLLRGDGLGGFVPDPPFATRSAPLFAGDLDFDGHADVVIETIAQRRILIGDGRGGFANRLEGPIGRWRPFAAADLDGDGDVDLLGDNVAWMGALFNDGTGSFAWGGSVVSLGAAAWDAALGDVDGDGRLDAIVSLAGGVREYVDVLRGLGPGGFVLAGRVELGGNLGGSQLSIADFDRDGFDDVVAWTGSDLVTLRGSAAGLLTDLSLPMPIRGYPSPHAPKDLDGDGWRDFLSAGFTKSVAIHSNVTACRAGNVGTRVGPPAEVLFVNDSAGEGRDRRVGVGVFQSLRVIVAAPPSAARPARFVVYAWGSDPGPESRTALPRRVGCLAAPLPALGASPAPVAIWNNTPFPGKLGAATRPSFPAPSFIIDRPNGARRAGLVYLQGLIEDRDSPSGRVAVTNGVLVDVR